MNQEVTLKISDRIIRQAILAASQKKHRVEEVLSDWLEEVFQEKFTDKEVIALTKIQISPEDQEGLSELLFKNRETGLNKNEQHELDLMVEISERNMLKKSEALCVAVERGLIEPRS